MTWKNVTFLILVVLLARLLFFVLDRVGNKKQSDKDGIVTMNMMGLYVYFGLFVTAFGLMLLIAGLRNLQESSAWGVVFLGSIASCFGAFVVAFGRGHKITYSVDEVEVRNWKGKTVKFKWKEIEQMNYLRTQGVFQLRLKDATVNCHYHLKGITNFLRLAQEYSGKEVQF